MTWIVNWNDVDYNIDPADFTTGELKRVKLLTGLTYTTLMQGIQGLDPEALGVLFYINDWRGDPNVKYDGYQGPPLRLILENMAGLDEAMDDLGKALPQMPAQMPEQTETTPTDGSPSSPSTVDTPEQTLIL